MDVLTVVQMKSESLRFETNSRTCQAKINGFLKPKTKPKEYKYIEDSICNFLTRITTKTYGSNCFDILNRRKPTK